MAQLSWILGGSSANIEHVKLREQECRTKLVEKVRKHLKNKMQKHEVMS